MQKVLVIVVVMVLVAAAAGNAHAAPPVYTVPTTVEEYQQPGAFDIDITYFTVRLPSALAEARLNLAIRGNGSIGGDTDHPAHGHDHQSCAVDVATTALVAWTCTADYWDDAANHESGGGGPFSAGVAYTIDGDELHEVKLEDLFDDVYGLPAALKVPDLACHFRVTGDCGIEFSCMDSGMLAMPFTYDEIRPLLKAGNPLTRARDATTPPAKLFDHTAPAQARFVANPDGTVLDRVTGLTWAGADNGANVSWDEAGAFAAGFHGGVKEPGWRLPTLLELSQLWEPHAEQKVACARTRVELDPAIKLSCGLVWTSDSRDQAAGAFGFVSGTPRWIRRSDKTNLRALPVRDAQKPPTSRPAGSP